MPNEKINIVGTNIAEKATMIWNVADEGVAARVDVAEMMGSSVHLHVNAEGRDVIIIVPTVDMKGNYEMGDTVRFSFQGNVAHVFSKDTEKNLEF